MDYVVPTTKTVPHVFDDSEAFTAMPQVFATAFLVGLFERACLDAIMPYLDWPAEQTVGTHIDVSHVAATPPDMTVTVDVELTTIDRRRLVFDVTAHDGIDEISRGRHERFVIDAATFTARVAEKAARSDDTAT
ncbi:MAG: thioesterase family protein [Actinobacteria bacterium]|nr:thioesterase family protein [Actinomycetota bacterium]